MFQTFPLCLQMGNLESLANLVDKYVQFLLNACVGLDEDVLCAFGEEIGPIEGPSEGTC